MSVVEAPDILYNETSNDTIVAEGASVHLKCEARGYPEPTVSWKRGNKMPIVLRDGKGTTRGKSLSEYPRNILSITIITFSLNTALDLCNYIILISILPH